MRLTLLVAAIGIAAAAALYLLIPDPGLLRERNPERTSFMEYRIREAERQGRSLEIRQQWVPLNRISNHLRRAVMVAEDGRFYQHRGVDWASIREELHYSGDDSFSLTSRADLAAALEAFRYYRANRDRIKGRSTITQQLVKNLYFTPERSLWRKAAELALAIRMERTLEKDRILELYLNVAEWGPGIFGVEAAARHYFGRSAAALTREQAASLAATLPHPLTSNPSHRPGQMAWRRDLILSRMGGAGPVETVPLEPPAPVEPALLGEPVPPGAERTHSVSASAEPAEIPGQTDVRPADQDTLVGATSP